MQHIFDSSRQNVTQFFPRNCKKDFDVMLHVLAHFNGTTPMQPLDGKSHHPSFYIDASKSNAYCGCGYTSRGVFHFQKFSAHGFVSKPISKVLKL